MKTLDAALKMGVKLVIDGYWIKIEYPYQQTGAKLDYGWIHSNGEREQAIGTMTFIPANNKDGVIGSIYTHP